MDITKETSYFKSKVFGSFTPEHERVTFIKKHKWILKADHLSEHFQKSVKLDVFNQEIVFETFTVQSEKASAQKWIKNMMLGNYNNETITMVHYDSKGEEIAKKVFKGLTVFGHKCYFDYEDGGTAVDTVYVKYDKEVELHAMWGDNGVKKWCEPFSENEYIPEKIAIKDMDIPEAIKLVVPEPPEFPDWNMPTTYEKIKYPEIYGFKTPETDWGRRSQGIGKERSDSIRAKGGYKKEEEKLTATTTTTTSSHTFDMTTELDLLRKAQPSDRVHYEKTPEVKKPLNLCTRKRLP